jgi:hypothetical protein
MDQYAFHSYFHVIDMDDVDIIFGYHLMESVGTSNINVKNKFLKLWSKKKKIKLRNFSLTNPILLKASRYRVLPTKPSSQFTYAWLGSFRKTLLLCESSLPTSLT